MADKITSVTATSGTDGEKYLSKQVKFTQKTTKRRESDPSRLEGFKYAPFHYLVFVKRQARVNGTQKKKDIPNTSISARKKKEERKGSINKVFKSADETLAQCKPLARRKPTLVLFNLELRAALGGYALVFRRTRDGAAVTGTGRR